LVVGAGFWADSCFTKEEILVSRKQKTAFSYLRAIPIAGFEPGFALRAHPAGWLRTGIPCGDRLRRSRVCAFPYLRAIPIAASNPAGTFRSSRQNKGLGITEPFNW